MSYIFPPEFDRTRARMFGGLIEAAYAQLSSFQKNQEAVYPVGWDIVLPRFVAHELGGGDGIGMVVREARGALTGEGGLLGRVESVLKVHEQSSLPFGFIARRGGELVVVIRGTNTPMEWVADARAMPTAFAEGWGSTTRGFMGLYSQIIPQILEAITPAAENGDITAIHVTGHSLGGALATLVSAGIYRELDRLGLKPETYTFSSPRVVDPDFVRAHNAAGLRTWRIFNTEDLVPTLPLAAVDVGSSMPNLLNRVFGNGFQHVGYPIGITSWHADLVSNHAVGTLCGML